MLNDIINESLSEEVKDWCKNYIHNNTDSVRKDAKPLTKQNKELSLPNRKRYIAKQIFEDIPSDDRKKYTAPKFIETKKDYIYSEIEKILKNNQ